MKMKAMTALLNMEPPLHGRRTDHCLQRAQQCDGGSAPRAALNGPSADW
jgi:hypothetical protein